jgi:hypothetical protein
MTESGAYALFGLINVDGHFGELPGAQPWMEHNGAAAPQQDAGRSNASCAACVSATVVRALHDAWVARRGGTGGNNDGGNEAGAARRAN